MCMHQQYSREAQILLSINNISDKSIVMFDSCSDHLPSLGRTVMQAIEFWLITNAQVL